MKYILSVFSTLLMALAIIIPSAAPVLADSNDGAKPLSPSLMIKSPNLADAGQPVTITISSRNSRETIAGASVYALKSSELVTPADSTDYKTLLRGYEAFAAAKGKFIGITSENGTATVKFAETGRFILVATKDGFLPGFARLTVTLVAKKGLNIKNPESTEMNKPVTISVTERYTHQPVVKAAVYAQLITTLTVPPISVSPSVKSARPQIISSSSDNLSTARAIHPQAISDSLSFPNAIIIKADPANTTVVTRYAEEIKNAGIFLDYTDEKGSVTYTFTNPGRYLLMAVKDSNLPGFSQIKIHKPEQQGQHQLGLKITAAAYVGHAVVIKAFDSNTGQALEKATVYAFKPQANILSPTIRPAPAPTENGTATAVLIDAAYANSLSAVDVQALLVQSKYQPILIGTTGDKGEVQYTFDEAGFYTLVAIKDGYIPGGIRVNVLSKQTTSSLDIDAFDNIKGRQTPAIHFLKKDMR